MCTMIAHQAKIEGRGKSGQDWFEVREANVSYDHPYDLPLEHALNIDFVNEAAGPGARVAVADHQHLGHIGLLAHRAFDRNGHRHGIAVLGDLRQVELDLAFGCGLAAGEFLDQVGRIVCLGRRNRSRGRQRACAHGQRSAAIHCDHSGLPSTGQD